MAALWVFISASDRQVFAFTTIVLVGSMSLILVVMLANPSLWPVWGIAGVAALLALTLAVAGWVWTHRESANRDPHD